MNTKCNFFFLLCVFTQLFLSCLNDKKEKIKENTFTFGTIDNITESVQMKEDTNTSVGIMPTHYDFLGDEELKVMICSDKKNGTMDLDSAKIFYGNIFPYAKDSISIWWKHCK